MLQETPFKKITSAFVASKCTSTLFLFLFHFCSPVRKTITSVALVFIFCCPYEITTENDDDYNIHYHLMFFLWNQGRRQQWTHLVLVFWLFFLHCKRQWQASPFIVTFYNSRKKKKKIKTHKKTMSLLACHRPLQPKKKNLDVGFSWVVGDDNEPPDLSCLLVFYPHL